MLSYYHMINRWRTQEIFIQCGPWMFYSSLFSAVYNSILKRLKAKRMTCESQSGTWTTFLAFFGIAYIMWFDVISVVYGGPYCTSLVDTITIIELTIYVSLEHARSYWTFVYPYMSARRCYSSFVMESRVVCYVYISIYHRHTNLLTVSTPRICIIAYIHTYILLILCFCRGHRAFLDKIVGPALAAAMASTSMTYPSSFPTVDSIHVGLYIYIYRIFVRNTGLAFSRSNMPVFCIESSDIGWDDLISL